jgi:hypothetical protein
LNKQNTFLMPIRMEQDDPRQQSGGNNNKRNRGGGGLSGLIRFLPLVLLFLFKRPKLIIPVLIVGAVWYFFLGGQQMLSGGAYQEDNTAPSFSMGASLDEEQYDKAQVFEPVSYGYGGSSLPSRATLEQYIPQRRHQGRQGSCVGWASAYAARTILQSQATGQNPNQVAFSPAYLYNQIALTGCQGAYMVDAMKTMQQNGALPFNQFRYTEQSCSNAPSSSQKQQGAAYRIRGFDRLTLGANNYKTDLQGIKQHVAQGYPVVIGMMVGGSFMNSMRGRSTWQPSQRDYGMRGFGGHAMCVIGYDDNKNGGAFQIMNSWGEDWGDDGIAWVRYRDFEHFTKEAYGIYPMASQQEAGKMAVEFGLLDVASQNTIGLFKKDGSTFRTLKPIKKGDKFKVLIANSVECYIYVFGQETDGSSYVLFPYTQKHSPYCGITGTRLFPRDHSMVADDIGSKDYIAVVVSKKELDFNTVNKRLNSSNASTYAGKLEDALGNQRATQVNFQAGKTVAFEADVKDKPIVGMVIEIDKQ